MASFYMYSLIIHKITKKERVFSFGERKGVGVADYLNKSPQTIPQLPQRGNFTWR